MFEKILVPLDGSNAAEIVLPYVAEIATKTNSSILLISVREPDNENMEGIYRIYLEHITDKLRSATIQYGSKDAVITTEVLSGNPANDIVNFAEMNKVGLIALSSRGASGRGPWLLGSVATKVIAATNRPILLIRAPADEGDIARKHLIKKILVPLDGSEWGEAAVPLVKTVGRALNSDIVLFQSVRFMEQSGSIESIEKWKASSLAYLNGVADSFQQKDLKVNIIVVEGMPADSIVDYARINSVDLIAMSSRGRSGIERWVLGSVTESVLHAGDTPVLVVRPRKT